MPPEWISSVTDFDTRETLERSAPIAFGSTSAGNGWSTWATNNSMTAERRSGALKIFAFDVFIENPDRRPSSPNVLVRGDQFRIFDHELAFRVRQVLGRRPEPWSPGYVDRLLEPDGHVFGRPLKRARELDTSGLRPAWSNLSDDDLAECQRCIPPEWAEYSNSDRPMT